jgi:hypothetical protein
MGVGSRFGLSDTARHADALAARLPDTDPLKPELRSAIAAFASECGCTMGGAFFAGGTVIALAYFVVTGMPSIGSALIAIGLVFVASGIGKIAGLTIARIRLLRLARTVVARLSSGEVACVHVH